MLLTCFEKTSDGFLIIIFVIILGIIILRSKIALGILVLFCIVEIRPILPYLEYYANYQYISEVLCVNKDKPLLNCNGKCYLSQQLKKAQENENKDKKIPTPEQERIPMIVCYYDLPNLVNHNLNTQKTSFYYQFSIKELFISPPSPPPKC